jgi:hypothetical protein
MPGQLITPREALGAARELACVWFLARMCANMSRLMLETVEGLITQRALVRSWEILSVLSEVVGHARHAHGCSGHFFLLSLMDLGQLSPGCFLFSFQGRLWIQQTVKIHSRGCALHVIAAAAM